MLRGQCSALGDEEGSEDSDVGERESRDSNGKAKVSDGREQALAF